MKASNYDIQIDSVTGELFGHNWHLLYSRTRPEGIFYTPTLALAVLVSSKCTNAIKEGGVLPASLKNRLEARLGSAVQPIIDRPKSFHLALGLTHNCSLNCVYCHAEADRDIRIESEYVDTAIDHAFKSAGNSQGKTLSVSFAVGGEPTLNWGEFTSAVNTIRKYEKIGFHDVRKVFLSMTTNCYYGERKREYVAEHFDNLTLSLDGYAEIQNLHRPNRRGGSSYSVVSDTCQYYLHSDKVKAGIRGTVSEISAPLLPDIIKHYHSEFGSGYTVAFEPLIKIGRALNGELNAPRNEVFAAHFWEAREIGKELGIRVITSAANIDRLVGRYCGAMAIPSFTVCTDGTITACHRDQEGTDYGYGYIDIATGTVLVDESKVESNVSKTEAQSRCESCFARVHCAGDCPDLRRIGYDRCDINQYLVFKQLEELFFDYGDGSTNTEMAAL